MRKVAVIVVNVLVCFLVVVAAEAIVRRLRPDLKDADGRYIRPDDSFNHMYTPNFRGVIAGPEKSAVILKTNSLGLPQASEITEPKPPQVFRVLIVGDSFIAGMGDPNTIPYIAQQSLAQKRTEDGRKIELVNCGQSSYSPLLHIARFNHQLYRLNADAVILSPDLTDVFDDWVRYKDKTVYNSDGSIDRVSSSPALSQTYRLYDRYGYDATNLYLVKGLIRRIVALQVRFFPEAELAEGGVDLGADQNDYVFEHAREEEGHISAKTERMVDFSVENIRGYIALMRSHHIPLSIMIYPHLSQIVPEKDSLLRDGKGVSHTFNRIYEKRIEDLCRREGIAFKSFYEEIAADVRSGQWLYFRGDMHFNQLGIQRMGELVANWISNSPRESIGVSLSDH
jgi:hypothetical protein